MTTITPVVIRNSRVHTLYAAEIAQEYKISVQLPHGYHESGEPYPVLYVLDGDQFFGMVTDSVRLLQHAKEVPDLLIVGIGYGTDTADHFINRIRDYSPSPIEQFPFGGGAEPFRSFLLEEVIPLINATYHTNATNHTLMGASISGLFVLDTMLQHPSLFTQLIVSSPSLFWDNFRIRQLEAHYAQQHADLPVHLFLSVGAAEEMREDIQAFSTTLAERRFPGLTLHTATFADETHFSVQPVALMRGVRAIYNEYNKERIQ